MKDGIIAKMKAYPILIYLLDPEVQMKIVKRDIQTDRLPNPSIESLSAVKKSEGEF